jgi:tRNA pseudouridine38-40 synthase
MPRFKLTIEYAGTRYSGWQIQQNARTVQGEIDAAVRRITGRHDFELYGSGRTDAGVHALAQVAHLDVAATMPPATLRQRLNDELPADINVLEASIVPHRFHARHDAVARRYLYQLARRRTAFAKPYVWWIKDPLDVARMRSAAGLFVGLRDFESFADVDQRGRPGQAARTGRAEHPGRDGQAGQTGRAGRAEPARRGEMPERDAAPPSTKVLVDRLDIGEEDSLVLVAIEGSHFLWKMVRRVVGVLVEIGAGRLEPSDAAAFLTARSGVPATLTAPPSGLFLERVYYKGEPRAATLKAATPLGSG